MIASSIAKIRKSPIISKPNYDNLDRLDNVYKGTGTPVLTLDMAYDSNKGGITTKSDAGTMTLLII